MQNVPKNLRRTSLRTFNYCESLIQSLSRTIFFFGFQAADDQVMEAYKKISTARSLKKPPSKKDREQAWKALKEREIILKNLEAV